MNKLNRVSAFVFSILATVCIGGAASANTVLEKQDTTVSVPMELSAKCAAPLNRDYHNVLSAYNSDTSSEYKFSGCGGVL